MPQTVLQVCTDSARFINLISEADQLSPEQGQAYLTMINDVMADYAVDGIDLGWYPQTSLSNTAPLQDGDMLVVKLALSKYAMVYYSLEETLNQDKKELMDEAIEKLSKRSVRYFESDMSGLPQPQGAWWGGGSINSF